jgi:cytochrome c2
MMKTILIVCGAMILCGSALAQVSGNAERGLRVARDDCAGCHAVESDAGESPNPAAPTFSAIARTSGMTELALYAALRTTHIGGQMPLVLPREADVRDVIGYIRSLRQGPQ